MGYEGEGNGREGERKERENKEEEINPAEYKANEKTTRKRILIYGKGHEKTNTGIRCLHRYKDGREGEEGKV